MPSTSVAPPTDPQGALPTVLAPQANLPAAQIVPGAAHETSREHVLIVEDDARSARMLGANITAAGYSVSIAASSAEAQQIGLATPPDLIICDICLPGMDGIQLTKWFRLQPRTANVPILLVTSSDDTKVLSRGLEAGADDFLTKPVNSLELRTRVRSSLRSKNLAEQIRTRGVAAERDADPSTPAGHGKPGASPVAAAQPETMAGLTLIVEDSEQDARLFQAYVGEMGYCAEVVHNAQAALASLAKQTPDLVVLDLVLPDSSGYDVIRHIKSNPQWERLPILVVSAMSQVEDRVKALELGADDFILKGFDRVEFAARVRRLLRHKQNLDQLNDNYARAMHLAITDSLTGLFTHGFLQESLNRHIAAGRRSGDPLSLVFLDIDHFKDINDRLGHAVGDEVLRRLAQVFQRTFRQGDILVRYGGEEFVALLPGTSKFEAATLAQRVRVAAEALAVQVADSSGAPVHTTVSIGVAGFPEDAGDGAVLLQHADEAMYLAKRAGRNTVVVFGQTGASPSQGQTVLLVDDDEKNLRLLEAYLKPEGYQTLRAQDGEEAIEVARRRRPDLILLDAMMPRLSGFDACRRLKQEQGTCLIPIVLVTALSGREDKLRGIEAGADDFLRKPIDKVELLTRTRALLRAKRTTDHLEDAETVIFTLARAVESRDSSTGNHVERVAHYAVALGKALGLSDDELDGLRRAGIVHDIGKILVPDSVLLKPGKLDPAERKTIEQHVEIGYELLRPLRTFSQSLDAVHFHHERRDGSGYPFGLKGDQIPISAQILAIVDVYDALTTDRVYRQALSREEALRILSDEAARGLHDPKLVETFETVVAQLG